MAATTKPAWPTAVAADRHAGTVTRGEQLIVTFDVDITPLDAWDEDAEFVIRVNGRAVRRMRAFQARRMGLLREGRD